MAYRTNSKHVRDAVYNHVLEHYDERGTEGIAEDMRAVARGEYGIESARNLVRGGNFLISYYDQREFLRDTLGQTQEEADKYQDEQVFRLYVELLAREIRSIHDDVMYSPEIA